MINAVFDANVLVSAFLSRDNPEEFQANSSGLSSRAPSTFTCPSQSSTRQLVFY
jgi:hypothetical protein